MTAISTSGLTKRFRGGQLAVDRIDLAVPLGSVYGFLGPNGSGKTTTIRMLLGLAYPTSGSASLLGVPMPDGATTVLHRVGSLVEGPAFYPFLAGAPEFARQIFVTRDSCYRFHKCCHIADGEKQARLTFHDNVDNACCTGGYDWLAGRLRLQHHAIHRAHPLRRTCNRNTPAGPFDPAKNVQSNE